MKNAIFKEALREIRRSKNRFISILAIIAVGCGFFAGVKSACPDMKLTARTYFDEHQLYDIQLISTYGFDENDLSAIEQLEGIRGFLPSWYTDVLVSEEGSSELIFRVLADSGDATGKDALNEPMLIEGRMPENSNECVVGITDLMPAAWDIGSVIELKDGGDDTLEDTLSTTGYTVVGFVKTPQFFNLTLGSTTIGDGQLDGYLIVPAENFTMDVYTSVYLTLEDTLGAEPFSEEYEQAVDGLADQLEAIADRRSDERYEEILAEAEEELTDARKELADGEQELADARKELEDAKTELDDARKELDDGWADYKEGQQTLETEVADGQQELADARKELEDGEAQYEQGLTTYEAGLAEFRQKAETELAPSLVTIQESIKQLSGTIQKGQTELDTSRSVLADIEEILEARKMEASNKGNTSGKRADEDEQKVIETANLLYEGLGDLVAQYIAAPTSTAQQEIAGQINAITQGIQGELDAKQAKLDNTAAQVSALQTRLDAIVAGLDITLPEGGRDGFATGGESEAGQSGEEGNTPAGPEAAIAQLDKGLAQIETELEAGQKELEQAKAQLDAAKAELDAGWKELEDGENTLESERQKGIQELANAYQELTDGEAEYADGLAEYQDGKAEFDAEAPDAEAEIADARQKIEDAEKELADLKKPVWYVQPRYSDSRYSSYTDDAGKVDAVAAVFPVFFVLVAALVCLTAMTRMVEEQRTQIGTLKALGYGRAAIISKYLIYAISASLIGGIVGLLIGFQLFPRVIINAYQNMYQLPAPLTPFRWGYAVACLAVAVLCTGLSAFAACFKELEAFPAKLMRPKAPKAGKRILLEQVGFIWKRLNFTHKVTVRNIFRYKKRVLMTVIGVAGCTALLLTGFGMHHAVTSIATKQYGEIFFYSGMATLDSDYTLLSRSETADYIRQLNGVSEALVVTTHSESVEAEGMSYDANIFVPENPDALPYYINLQERQSGKKLELTDDGVIITEKLSTLTGLKKGDTLNIRIDEQLYQFPIAGIAENYALHYVYISPELYTSVTGKEQNPNTVLFNLDADADQSELSSIILKRNQVLAVSLTSEYSGVFTNLTDSMSIIVWVLILSAGALAVIVMYNLISINVSERTRELATIKVLGFHDNEVSAYICRENTAASLLGMIFGLGLGILLERFVILTAEVDAVMFAHDIPWDCFLWSALLTILFTLGVNLVVHFNLKKISMVESMKAVE